MATTTAESELLPLIRGQVRERLLGSRAFRALSAERRARIARDTVKALHYILGGQDGTTRPAAVVFGGNSPVARQLAPVEREDSGDETAGQRFAAAGAVAAEQGGEALAELASRVDFPRFVAGLIDGVFNAIVSSSIKQMEAYADLVKNVAKSVDQYMRDNVSDNNARDYLADRYPAVLEIDISGDKPSLKVKEGYDEGNLPDFAADLGLSEPLSALDDEAAETTLVPAARRRMALDRQQLLATMVMMGVNRLVVTNGNIEASCLFELDTRDEVKRRTSQTRTADWQRQQQGRSISVGRSQHSGGSDWGGSAETQSAWFTRGTYNDTTKFKVTTSQNDDSAAKVDMHAKLGGKVNIQFKSDHFPMERMVDVMQIQQIRQKTAAGGVTGSDGTPTTKPESGPPAAQAPARVPA